MSAVGFGPLSRIDGPLPLPPLHGLLPTAEAPAGGVTIVTDLDSQGRERWMNGVEVYPYPPGPAYAWNACAPGTYRQAKESGPDVTNPQFDPITLYLAERCSSVRIDQDNYTQRATAAFAAKESAGLAAEFMTGTELPLNPNLGNSAALQILNGGVVTSPVEALAQLEWAIGQTGSLGLIHISPSMATALAGSITFDREDKVFRSPVGSVVIPDAGYSVGVDPAGGVHASGTQEWIFATGAIEIRRSEVFVLPERISEAIDRESNEVVYRVERYYLIDWDVQFHAAVLADRCQTAC